MTAPTYLRREIQSAAKRVRQLVEDTPSKRQPEPGEHETLECRLIRYLHTVAKGEHDAFGKTSHVFSGFLLSLLFGRYRRALRRMRYLSIQEGRVVVRMTKAKATQRIV